MSVTKLPQSQSNILLDHYQNGRYDDAEKLAILLTEQFPHDQFSWKVLGATLKKKGKVSESLVASQKAVDINPQDVEAHSNLGNTLHELGKFEEAEASYRQAVIINPDYAIGHNNLGNTLKELGRLQEAQASYKQAVTINPDYAIAHNNLGVILQELGRLQEAHASYKQAVTINSDYANAHNNLGVILQKLGKFQEAQASYRQAVTINPDYAIAHNNLGVILQKLGKFQEAQASYRQAVTINPDYAIAHNNLGNSLKELGKYQAAESSYKQAITINPDYSEAYYNLGVLYLDMARNFKELKQINEAVKYFKEALKVHPEDSFGATLELVRLGHKNMPDKTPLNYMQGFYKIKSKSYELNEDKKYNGHLLIKNAFKATYNKQDKLDILDLGCGSGSLAGFLRPYAKNLYGVDLSPDMLHIAEKTQLYDSLHQDDLLKYLSKITIQYDKVLAAAVMVHFSKLENVFSLVSDRLKIKGEFIFSIFEGTQKDIELNSSFFYEHSSDYITSLANQHKLKIVYKQQGVHEYHKEIPVSGLIYVLQKSK